MQPFQNVKTILRSWTVKNRWWAGYGHRLPFAISGLVNKLGDYLFKARMMVGHTALSYHVSMCSLYASPPTLLLTPRRQPPLPGQRPFLTWIALPEPFLPIEIIALKILSDATSSVKPYPVPEAQSYILSILCFSFVPPLRHGFHSPLYANCIHA